MRLDGDPVLDWTMYRLPLDDLSALRFTDADIAAPAFHRGSFVLADIGGSFIDMRGWGKGHVWVNGHHLGRFWKVGPQQSLYVPASWLRRGRNEIVVLDVEPGRHRSVRGLIDPVFETPQ